MRTSRVSRSTLPQVSPKTSPRLSPQSPRSTAARTQPGDFSVFPDWPGLKRFSLQMVLPLTKGIACSLCRVQGCFWERASATLRFDLGPHTTPDSTRIGPTQGIGSEVYGVTQGKIQRIFPMSQKD